MEEKHERAIEHLRTLIELMDTGELRASPSQRAFLAGALETLVALGPEGVRATPESTMVTEEQGAAGA